MNDCTASTLSMPQEPTPTAPTRRKQLALMASAWLILAACATPQGEPAGADDAFQTWSGRLGLSVASNPPEQFFAGFVLRGNARNGELSLSSPLGSTLAQLQWRPGEALLRQAGQVQDYPSVDALAAAVTGTAVPVQALFAWLGGSPQTVPGWRVNLDRLDDGRITAHRFDPAPAADLRVVLDR